VQVQQTATLVDRTRAGRDFRVAHAEDPARPGTALCGTKLSGRLTSASSERCVVCLDLARRRGFVGR
jgi:hypothetical protein